MKLRRVKRRVARVPRHWVVLVHTSPPREEQLSHWCVRLPFVGEVGFIEGEVRFYTTPLC